MLLLCVFCIVPLTPLLAGLVGIIPALGMMTTDENPPNGPVVLDVGQLLLWSFSLVRDTVTAAGQVL